MATACLERAASTARIFCAPLLTLLLLSSAHATEFAQPARMLEAVHPEYPKAALRREEEGRVLVRARILASGQASDVQVEKGSGVPELDRAALSAVQRSRFQPAVGEAGLPVDSWVSVPFKFVLQDDPRRP